MKHKRPPLSPLRKKFNCIFLPIWCTAALVPLIVICVLMAVYGEEKYEPYMLIWTACVLGTGLLSWGIFLPWIQRKEALQSELQRYGYLFQDPKPLTEQEVKIEIDFVKVTYTLTQEGLIVEREQNEQDGGQVFDEVQENRRFLPWNEVQLALATQKGYYCVHIAMAVLFDQSADHKSGMVYFIPMQEKLYQAIRAFQLVDKLDAGWAYLCYNPEDAFKQIIRKGRILVMRNKKTGKPFADRKEFLDEQDQA